MTQRSGALVTGAAGNIGSALADALLSRGLIVVGIDVVDAPESLGARSDYRHLKLDVKDIESRLSLEASAFADMELRHVACIAGGAEPDDGGSNGQGLPTVEIAQRAYANNFLGPLATVRACLPLMAVLPGDRSFTFCSSVNALAPWARPGYSSAKAALEQLTLFLAETLGRQGIRANAVVPGTVVGSEGRPPMGDEGLARELKATIPLQRFATGENVASAFLTLMLDLTHVTGSLLKVDGGQDLRRGFPAIKNGDFRI